MCERANEQEHGKQEAMGVVVFAFAFAHTARCRTMEAKMVIVFAPPSNALIP